MNVDESPRTASRYGIRGVPALYFLKNGEVLDHAVGAPPVTEIERRIEALLR